MRYAPAMRGASLLAGLGCAATLVLAAACGSERPPVVEEAPDGSAREVTSASASASTNESAGGGPDLDRCSCTVPKFTFPCDYQLCMGFVTYTCLSNDHYTTEIPCGQYDAGAADAAVSSAN